MARYLLGKQEQQKEVFDDSFGLRQRFVQEFLTLGVPGVKEDTFTGFLAKEESETPRKKPEEAWCGEETCFGEERSGKGPAASVRAER